MSITPVQNEIDRLKQERDWFDQRCHILSDEIEFRRTHRTLRDAIAGEKIISRLIAGKRTANGAPHDIEKGDIRLEVKFSNLNNTSSPSGKYTRWAWGKIFGEGGNKHYDYLILVGVKDQRWRQYYKDKLSPYVYFCIPHGQVDGLTQSMNNRRYRAIQLPSNPQAVRRSRAARLYSDFETSYEELEAIFRLRPEGEPSF